MKTEMNYLEEELYKLIREDQSIFEFLQKGSLDGLWYWDIVNPENEWMNPQFWSTLGYAPEEKKHLSSEWQDIIHPEDLRVAIENFNKHCADPNHPYDQIVRYRHKDGSTVWVRCRGIAIRDESGKPIRMLGAHNDLTRQMQAKEELRKNEELFRTLAELAPVGIYLTSVEGYCQYANPCWCEMAGLCFEEALGEGWIKGLHPEDREFVFSKWKQMVASEGHWGYEYRFKTPAGKITWVYGLAKPQRDAKGKIVGYVGINTDITERKKADEALRKSDDRYRQVTNNIPGMLYQLLMHKDGSYSVPYASDKIYEYSGFNPAQVAADPSLFFKPIYYEDINYIQEQMRQSAENLSEFMVEHRLITPSGEVKWFKVKSSPTLLENGDILWNGISIDITERKIVEEQNLQKDKMLTMIHRNVPVGMGMVDSDRRFHWPNTKLAQITGYCLEELEGMQTRKLYATEKEYLRVGDLQKRNLSKTNFSEVETEWTRQDGRIVNIILNASYKNSDDPGQGIIGTALDITERIRAVNNLKINMATLDAVFKSAPNIMLLVNNEGQVEKINHKGITFSGRKIEELIGHLGGEVLGCLNSFDGQGCGRNHVCLDCPVRTRVESTLQTGEPHNEEEGKLTFILDGEKIPLDLLISTKLIELDNVKKVLVSITDITKIKQAEDFLRQERNLFDRIMETSPVGITRVDAVGKLVYANKRAEKILGGQFSEDEQKAYDDPAWKIKDLNGKPFPAGNLPFNLVKKTQKSVYDIRHAIEWPDGRQVFLSINATPLFNDSEEFDGMVAVIEDITEKYKAEQDYEMLFREMLDGFALHEIICDDSGNPVNYRFLAINPAFERLTGLSANFLIGKTVLDVLPQTEFYWIEKYGKVALTGEPDAFENYSKELNRFFQVTAFRYAKNQFACIFADITQRKSAEADRNRLVEAIKQAGESIVITSPDGSIQYVNPAFEKMTGYSKEIAVGKNPRFLKSGVQGTTFYKTLWDTILSGNRWTGQLVNKNKDGGLYTSECSISPVKDENGNVTNFVWISKDITRQIEAEERMSQAQKMEAIGVLAGGIAHDFNNILFPIVGHAEILMEDSPDESPLRESLNEIYTGALRARDLVQQILSFSRQEKNELKLMKMQPIIKEALKLIRATISTTISINQNLDPNCGAVKADPTQIHQIVMNLATNAYHAMEDTGGELKVSLKEVELGEYDLISPDMKPGAQACLTFSDTGKGMKKDIMNKVFEPFFTTKEKGKGTGMGLSVVHGIVKNMSGAIQVHSEPGKGTEFNIFLPVVKSTYEKQEAQASKPIPGGHERILLVDDEEAIIAMEKQILERFGYKVTSCDRSIEALEAFRANPGQFDLVITDMSMPKMSGDKLAIELIKIRPDIPVLLCTGFSESMTDEKIKSLGIKGFLMKPIVIKDLAKKLREVLDEDKNGTLFFTDADNNT